MICKKIRAKNVLHYLWSIFDHFRFAPTPIFGEKNYSPGLRFCKSWGYGSVSRGATVSGVLFGCFERRRQDRKRGIRERNFGHKKPPTFWPGEYPGVSIAGVQVNRLIGQCRKCERTNCEPYGPVRMYALMKIIRSSLVCSSLKQVAQAFDVHRQ